MAQITYLNDSHKRIIESIINAKHALKKPVMLTANQFDKNYTVSLGWASIGIVIPKEELNRDEILAITDEQYGGRIILNDVWEAKI